MGPKRASKVPPDAARVLLRNHFLAPPQSANFEKIDVPDVLGVTNPQKSRKKCRLASTRAPETFRNLVFQPSGDSPKSPPNPIIS